MNDHLAADPTVDRVTALKHDPLDSNDLRAWVALATKLQDELADAKRTTGQVCAMLHPPSCEAADLHAIGRLFATRLVDGADGRPNGGIELYVEDDGNYHQKAAFDRFWLPDLIDVLQRQLTLAIQALAK